MATTNLIALHAGKEGDVHKVLMRTIGYVETPDKTENGTLITSYQCDPRTAAAEFFLDKRTYKTHTSQSR